MANMAQAVRMALHYGETHLGVTDVFGEDVGPPLGGVFTVTQGLKTAWNTPLDERGILGTAMGIAYAGGRPVCEIQFCDYAFNVLDLFKVAGNQRWASGGGLRILTFGAFVAEGGVPILSGGEIVGGIGVSGVASYKDAEVAMTGATAILPSA